MQVSFRRPHAIIDALLASGLSSSDEFVQYFPKTRDRSDVQVLACKKSGVFVLDRTDHIQPEHYANLDSRDYWKGSDRATALRHTRTDDRRRGESLRGLVCDRRWVDVGSGLGGVLDELGAVARSVIAVEPQSTAREDLKKLGYQAVTTVQELADASTDIITLFHVLEHVVDPIGFLKTLRTKLAPGGTLVLEVPHARDALIVRYNCEAFKAFTFWSEHLILHTRSSLTAFLGAAGFEEVRVKGCQRYSLANHLHWLTMGKPGGQNFWPELASTELESSYANTLAVLDNTDTLLAFATAGAGAKF